MAKIRGFQAAIKSLASITKKGS
ncbi:hypothetical protein CCACVL1_29555 [Corchorus capsularis]|uniref:Uncharacterized protein n=1 Tax=Corchorus capsularis TaxID=210143 RepID=A0A1R3G184_COCAP|nr:hypothetical protein CCACVL1_29555 [Corchorus capsularis]